MPTGIPLTLASHDVIIPPKVKYPYLNTTGTPIILYLYGNIFPSTMRGVTVPSGFIRVPAPKNPGSCFLQYLETKFPCGFIT